MVVLMRTLNTKAPQLHGPRIRSIARHTHEPLRVCTEPNARSPVLHLLARLPCYVKPLAQLLPSRSRPVAYTAHMQRPLLDTS